MTLIWLRVALICYAAGLLYALVALTRTSDILAKIALHASYLGMVFLLTFVAATRQHPLVFASAAVMHGWLAAHIIAIFTGYAALFVSFAASLLYLLQERALKSKSSSGMFSRLPALQTIDDIGYRSLMFGFPFMTLGLIFGSVVAEAAYHRVDF